MSGALFQRNVIMISFNNLLLSNHSSFLSITVIKIKTEESFMKRIYTLVLAVFAGVAVMAADNRPRSGMVTVSVKENAAVRISVDGRDYSDRDNTVSISNLAPGYHSIQVFALSNKRA